MFLENCYTPVHYQLHITTDLQNFTFQVDQTIDLKWDPLASVETWKSKSQIQLHSVDLNIDSSSIKLVNPLDQSTIPFASMQLFEDKRQMVVLHFEESSWASQLNSSLKLSLRCQGKLTDQLCGFYRSSFLNAQTQQKEYLACTQFEPCDARRAFVCFDEPNLKATFDICLTAAKHYTTFISNMPIKSTSETEQMKTVSFETTPIMSTYLVAYVIGNLEYLETKTERGIPIRTYSMPGTKEKTRFALDVASKSLTYFENYFGIPYYAPKLDLVAIPDFSAGAMENLGCVLYRLTRIIVDEKTSLSTKQATAKTISHENSHMWFGNLVTMKTFTYLWLNEGFARFVEHFSVSEMFPQWDMWTQFVANVLCVALNLDSLKTSHPVEVEVHDSGQINEIFDAISYAKGGSINRMCADWIGKENMQKGLHHYLTKYSYQNTVTEDLWECLSEISQKPVKQIMDGFVKQTGYPVIFASKTVNDNSVQLHLKQQRFLLDGTTDDQLWQIPVKIVTQQGITKEFIFKEKENVIPLEGVSEQEWIKLNSNQTGFYRVCYSQDMFSLLCNSFSELKPSDRVGLLNDLFALCVANKAPATQYLQLLQSVAQNKEREYYVWSEVASGMNFFRNLFLEKENYNMYWKKFTASLFLPMFEQFGWQKASEQEKDTDQLLRALIIANLSHTTDVNSKIKDEFDMQWKSLQQNSQNVTPDLLLYVLKTAVKHGDEQVYSQVKQIYKEAKNHEEKLKALQALCAAESDTLIQKNIEMAFDTEQVQSQDISYPLGSLASNGKARFSCFDYAVKEWDRIYRTYGTGNFLLSGIVGSITSTFTSLEMVKQIQQFESNNQNKLSGAERTIKQSMERIENRARFYQHQGASMEEWLQTHFSS